MIPLKAMRDVLFEFKMNPYAYFTSNVGCPRSYRVNQFELEVELTYFDKPTTDALEGQLDGNGIILSTYSFYLGPPQNIAANAIPGSV